jgi:hypothetical protein
MQKWEYTSWKFSWSTIQESQIETHLAKYGDDGWELAASIILSSDQTLLVFKRVKPVVSEPAT